MNHTHHHVQVPHKFALGRKAQEAREKGIRLGLAVGLVLGYLIRPIAAFLFDV